MTRPLPSSSASPTPNSAAGVGRSRLRRFLDWLHVTFEPRTRFAPHPLWAAAALEANRRGSTSPCLDDLLVATTSTVTVEAVLGELGVNAGDFAFRIRADARDGGPNPREAFALALSMKSQRPTWPLELCTFLHCLRPGTAAATAMMSLGGMTCREVRWRYTHTEVPMERTIEADDVVNHMLVVFNDELTSMEDAVDIIALAVPDREKASAAAMVIHRQGEGEIASGPLEFVRELRRQMVSHAERVGSPLRIELRRTDTDGDDANRGGSVSQ